jgi:FtsH-binding integral membrane protein
LDLGDDDEKDRMNFVRKVYGILSLQLLLTVALVAGFQFGIPL